MFAQAGRQQVDLDRALGGLPQAEAHYFPKEMRALGEFLAVDTLGEFHVAERVEILYRDIEFLLEETIGVRNDRAATRQEEPRRGGALLLAAVEVDRPRHLGVKAGHDVAGDLADLGDLHVLRLLVGPAEGDKAGSFELVRLEKRHAEFRGEALGDRVARNRDGPRKHLALLHEQQVGGAGADIQDHRATFEIPVVVADGVVQRHRRNIHHDGFEAGSGDVVVQILDNVVLDRQQDDVQLAFRVAPDQLVIPADFLDRERYVLLGLVLDDLDDLRLVNRRQFDKPGEDRLAGHAEDGFAALDGFLAQHVADT